jgi:hypothetical protein
MDDKHLREPDDVRGDADLRDDTEPSTSHDVVEGGAIGVVGGAIVGGLAGGPLGAVIGAVAGGVAGAAGVAVVDHYDHDYERTVNHAGSDSEDAPVAAQGDYGSQPVAGQGGYGVEPTAAQSDYGTRAAVSQDLSAAPPAASGDMNAVAGNPEMSGGVSSGGAAAYDDDYTGDYRNHFQTVYGASGASYDEYDEAYRYGANLVNASPFHTGEWDSVERFARPDWETRHEGTWERFKDSVRYGWNRAKAKTTGRPAGVYNDTSSGVRQSDFEADEMEAEEDRPVNIG